MNLTILLMGSPGVGKGTLAAKLASNDNMFHVNVGNIVRFNIKTKTPLGIIANQYTSQGKLVPDQEIDHMVEKHLEQIAIKNQKQGIILDGYPRNLHQAQQIKGFLAKINKKLDVVFWLEASPKVLLSRITNRLICLKCHQVYNKVNTKFTPQVVNRCDHCFGKIVARNDDHKDVVSQRLLEYQKQTTPLFQHFSNQVRLIKINANQSFEKIFSQVQAHLEKIKTQKFKNIKAMEQAGKILAIVQNKLASLIQPGVKLIDLDTIAEKMIRKHGAKPAFKGYNNFPNTICSSVNEQVVHGIPSDYALQVGDIVSIDIGVKWQGHYCDGARTYPVGKISQAKKSLITTTKNALSKALAQVKAGIRVGDISSAICQYVYQQNMSIPEEFCGHGIGLNLHEKPHIPNIGKANQGKILQVGDTIAIEPIVILGQPAISIKDDGWTAYTQDLSPAAHFEETIEVTKKGYRILTSLQQEEIIHE